MHKEADGPASEGRGASHRENERLRAGIVSAQEALELGATVEANRILLALVEDGGSQPLPRLLCPECALDCHWFGRLEQHRLNVHGVELHDASTA